MNSIQEALNTTAHVLLSPVQAVVSFFAPWDKARSAEETGQHALAQARVVRRSGAVQPSAVWSPTPLSRTSANQARFAQRNTGKAVRPVRVLRIADESNPPHCAGRMVISGRLSEVCAELERLSRQELLGAGNATEAA